MKVIAIACMCLALCVTHASTVYATPDVHLPAPAGKTGEPAGLVFIEGAQIPAKAYIPLVQAIQDAVPFPLYASIPQFILSTPEPLQLDSKISDSKKAILAMGLNASSSPKFFYGAHSLGTVFLQSWVFSHAKDDDMAGQILTGGSLLRKYRNGSSSTTFPVPTLTLDGTLDGLYRVSRQAETYYHYQLHAADPAAATANFPVVVYEGVNHMQFASGTPPLLVKKSDLKSEVDEAAGHTMMANTINSFMQQHHTTSSSNSGRALASLQSEIDQTGKIVAPLIAALEQEAFIHFKPSCNSDYPMPDCPAYPRYPSKQQGDTPQRDCVCGTPWVQAVAQDTMAGLESAGVKVVATDAVHSVSDVTPIHLPHLWSNCSSEAGCTLNVTTVTQPIYSSLDGLDTGYSYTSASELRVKLKSREAMWTAAGRKNVNFTQTDVIPSLCAEINKKAVQWALDNAGDTAKARFTKNGEPLQMGNDIFKGNVGPLWIYNSLKYNEAKDKSSVTVDAPCSHTPIDYSIKSAAGYHYCKLLSPARAMEWLYIDGLRAKAHI